jgi:hypothetical protein
VRPRDFVRIAAGAGFAVALIAASVASEATPALAAGLNSRLVPGSQEAVACLSPRLCAVAGYNTSGVGDVVPVRSGVPGPSEALAGTTSVYDLSCPGTVGCVAIADPSSGAGLLVARLTPDGAIASSTPVKVPAGVVLSRVSCATLSSCVLTGVDVFASPEKLEVADWVGGALTLHPVAVPSDVSDIALRGISCSGHSCLAVGYGMKGTETEGLVISISGGLPTHLGVVSGDSFYGDSCGSPTLCYAVGFDSAGGVVVAVSHGTPGTAVGVHSDLFGVACRATSCEAFGQQLAPQGSPAGVIYYGTVVDLSAGKVTSVQLVPLSAGFTSASQSGGTFTAVGAAQHKGSEITTAS